MKRRLTILGSTGSIGLQALDVVRLHRERFEIVGLSAGGSAKALKEQAEEFKPSYVALESSDADTLDGLAAEKIAGPGASATLAEAPADVVLNGIVGFAGLASTVRALKSGNTVALANKESLVTGGDWIMGLAEAINGTDNRIIPVDSEHSAIFQCLEGRDAKEVREILLTASGGPFFGYAQDELSKVGPEDALKHPTWRMGPKITIDSSTMMNKGLEAIEAHHLFGVPYDRIRVAVHRQSVVHGGAVLEDGSAILHAALPDMRLPISYGILYPERIDVGAKQVGFGDASWTFEEPRNDVFRCLPLAIEAGSAGGAYPVALNAANEVAVGAFLDRRIEFLRVAKVIEEVLETVPEFGAKLESMEAIVDVDRWSRERAEKVVGATR
ncbi:MAG TPA: 1-deoxy-D-xylulose-5-phosphate reductoisomerase [Rubrobacteraceae bacterium]|nr:1-deoxy-D-xylulose-5-phosphate reductoisomerase [Rubrobacteraceae bacterium]